MQPWCQVLQGRCGNCSPVGRIVRLTRFVASDVAAHGPQLDPFAPKLREKLADLRPSEPTVPFYSTVTEDPRTERPLDGAYWADNLRMPVRFTNAVRAAAEDGYSVFLEISVHPITTYAMRETLQEINDRAVVEHTVNRDDGDHATIVAQLAKLYCAGVPIDFSRQHAEGRLIDLPATTWHRKRHWVDLPLAHPGKRTDDGKIAHPLLGTHTKVPDSEGRHVWRSDLGTAAFGWLAEHQVNGVTVLPGAAFCELALAAGSEAFGCPASGVGLLDLQFTRLLPLDEHTTVYTSLTPNGTDEGTFDVRTAGEGEDEWTVHASARLRRVPQEPPPAPVSIDALTEAYPDQLDAEFYYEALHTEGYQHGPAFQGLRALHTGHDEGMLARVAVPPQARTLAGPVSLHPVLLDAGLQALLASVIASAESPLFFPVGVGSLRIFDNPANTEFCHVTPLTSDSGRLRFLAEDGTVLAEANEIRFTQLDAWLTTSRVERLFHEIRWQPAAENEPGTARGQWYVLGTTKNPLVSTVRSALTDVGVPVSLRPVPNVEQELELLAAIGSVSDVVLVPGDGSPGFSLQDARTEVMAVARVARLLGESSQPPRLWIVTAGARALEGGQVALEYGGIRGLSRVIMCEYPKLRATLVDLDPGELATKDLVHEFFIDDQENEVAWRNGRRWIARVVNKPVSGSSWQSRPHRTLHYGHDGIAIGIARPGDLDTLGEVARPRRKPAEHEVEIQLNAVGLNFADVLNMLDLLPDWQPISGQLGLECAGTVIRIGDGVRNLRVGDRVMAFHDGVAGTFSTVPAALAVRVPDGITDIEAAGLPAAYLTAWYGLITVARLQPGERVLIHAGSGGVGLAAINIAKARGARIFATAGSERKRSYLRDLGVEQVMDSRSLEFVAETMAATDGEGVDVVLNSLSGLKLTAGLDVLGIGGRFVEIGKRDINADTKLGMLAFRRNIVLASVDIALLAKERPNLIATLLSKLSDELSSGRLDVLPCTEFDFTDSAAAIRYMAAAKHIGKLVLTVPQTGATTAAIPVGAHPTVRADAGYIITGGLGGLGLELTRWLAKRGAGKVVLCGRSAPTEHASRVLAEVRAAGTAIEIISGDIAEPEVATLLVNAATADQRPLRGVLHTAAVLDDGALTRLDEAQLDRVWRPKVDGAWRLHEATEGIELDWFVLFSSIASMLGSPGQANYAAANDWLDSFAQWRRAQDLAALSVSWGAWGQAGRATDLGQRGYATLSTADGLAALDCLLDHGRTTAGVFVYDPQHWFHTTPEVTRSSLFAELQVDTEGTTQTSSEIRNQLRDSVGAARVKTMERYLADAIRTILGLDGQTVEPTSTLSYLGFDSLSALQLRNRLETDLEIRVPTTAVWTHSTLAGLAQYLLRLLGTTGNDTERQPEHATSSAWFRTLEPRSQATARLYCFPHAGGSASAYRTWTSHLPEHETFALQLPGREDRIDEELSEDLPALADELASSVMADSSESPFLFFGHSGGSLLAFETARALRRRGAPSPAVLALSAMFPPRSDGMAARPGSFRGEPGILETFADCGALPADRFCTTMRNAPCVWTTPCTANTGIKQVRRRWTAPSSPSAVMKILSLSSRSSPAGKRRHPASSRRGCTVGTISSCATISVTSSQTDRETDPLVSRDPVRVT